MPPPSRDPEVIGSAGDGRVGERVALWLLAHRGLTRRGSAAVVVVGLVVGAGFAAVAGARYLRGPDLPRVVATVALSSATDVVGVAWDTGSDSRPATPATISVRAALTLRGVPGGKGGGVQLLGLTGPGLTGPGLNGSGLNGSGLNGSGLNGSTSGPGVDERPLVVQAASDGRPTDVVWDLPVACDAVPELVPVDAYRLRVRVSDGTGRHRTGDIPAGQLGARFAQQAQTGCGVWLAQRDLALTAATAAVDPRQPQARFTLTVTNAGARPARLIGGSGYGYYLTFGRPTSSGIVPLEVSLHARSTTTVAATLNMTDCSGVTATPMVDASSGATDTLSVLGVTGMVGPDASASVEPGNGIGIGPTGLRIVPSAVAGIQAVMSELCPLRMSSGADILPPGERWDPAHRVLTIPVGLDLPRPDNRGAVVLGGVISGAVFGAEDTPTLLTPTDTPVTVTVDATHTHLAITLTYWDPQRATCSDGRLTLPGPTLDLRVRADGGVRTVPVQLSLPPVGWAAACP